MSTPEAWPTESVEHDVEAVLAQWRPWVIGKVYEILGSGQPHLFEDAQQEAMIRLWTRLEEGLPVPIALHAAKQAVIDVARGRRMTGSTSYSGHVDTAKRAIPFTRKTGPAEEYTIEPADRSATAAYEQFDTVDALEGAFTHLTEAQREAVIAVHLGGMTAEDFGRDQGVTGQAIRYRLKKAMVTLREHLDDVA